jgi:hypothetical protein
MPLELSGTVRKLEYLGWKIGVPRDEIFDRENGTRPYCGACAPKSSAEMTPLGLAKSLTDCQPEVEDGKIDVICASCGARSDMFVHMSDLQMVLGSEDFT